MKHRDKHEHDWIWDEFAVPLAPHYIFWVHYSLGRCRCGTMRLHIDKATG